MPTTPLVTFRLSGKTLIQLDQAAAERGRTRSDVMRLAVADYVTSPSVLPHPEMPLEQPEHITIRLSEPLVTLLTQHATVHGTSISNVLRHALSAWLIHHHNTTKVGGLSHAAH